MERIYIDKNYNAYEDMDSIPRQFLWQAKEEYFHETGHGVGHFLCVVEGPTGVAMHRGNPPYKKNACISIEPAYSNHVDKIGIKIENLAIIREDESDSNFFRFENITFIPYERNLIDMKLLSDDHIEFINNYHKKTREIILPILKESNDPLAVDYLERNTEPLKRK